MPVKIHNKVKMAKAWKNSKILVFTYTEQSRARDVLFKLVKCKPEKRLA